MEIIAATDTGRVRRNNEDAYAFDAAGGVAVLADGMGGLEAGEVASRLAVERVLEALKRGRDADDSAVVAAILDANNAICEQSRERSVEMGTTLVVWLLKPDGQCLIAHVGDSRAYRLRSGKLKRLTRDHSMVQQMVDDGILNEAEAETAPNRNVITRALGLGKEVEVDIKSWVHRAGDIYLLCSDGLTDLVSDAEIEAVMKPLSQGDTSAAEDGSDTGIAGPSGLQAVASALVEQANAAGGYDNISILLVQPD